MLFHRNALCHAWAHAWHNLKKQTNKQTRTILIKYCLKPECGTKQPWNTALWKTKALLRGGSGVEINAAEHLILNSSESLKYVISPLWHWVSYYLGSQFLESCKAQFTQLCSHMDSLSQVLSTHSGWGLVLLWYSIWEQLGSSRDEQLHKCTLLS